MTVKATRIQAMLASGFVLLQGCVTEPVQEAMPGFDYDAYIASQTGADDARFEKFAANSEQSRYSVDHGPWTRFLTAAVIDVGPSSRQGAARRTGGVHTGTRISTGSRSRYRFESNKVVFHLFNADTLKFIAAYRESLSTLMDQYEYSDFSRDEQLAFWLNLHNVIVMDEVAKRHPVARPHTIRYRDQGNVELFDAVVVSVAGEPLSLNDIRHKIVYANWSEPEVLYGFWEGSIGGVDIQTAAFTGATVWPMLRSNGRRYVNSLRGVEPFPGSFGRQHFRISKVYWDARRLFPEWPQDVYAHLDSFAGNNVGNLLTQPPPILRQIPYDSATTDFSGGEIARFGGSDNIAAILSLSDESEGGSPESPAAGTAATILENFGAPVQSATSRGGVSADSLKLRDQVLERRRLRDNDVTIDDVDTPDREESSPDQPETDAEAEPEGGES